MTRYSLCIVSMVCLRGQLVVTEVMYNLEGTDSPNEFVEVYNLSATDTVNLSGWVLRDKFSTDTIEDAGNGRKIPPGGYGLIMEGDYSFSSDGIYAEKIPDGAVVMKVDDKSIGNGLSNSDSLYVINTSGQAVDSLSWADSKKPGFSAERVRYHHPGYLTNWKTSRDSLGTPGTVNSVYPLETDGYLLLDSLHLSKDKLLKTDFTVLSGTIINEGLNSLSGEIVISENENTLASKNIVPLSELDTASFSIDLGPFAISGEHLLTVLLLVAGDEDTTNNIGYVPFSVQYDWNTIVLNEFMARPNNDQTEFVELISKETFSMENWSISDNSLKKRLLPSLSAEKNDFIVVAPDSGISPFLPDGSHLVIPLGTFPTLNNSGDAIYLYDMTGFIIDSLVYDANFWQVFPEVSTEKLWPEFISNKSENWKSAPDSVMMTPGAENAVVLLPVDGVLIQDSVRHVPHFPKENELVTLRVSLANNGMSVYSGTIKVEENEKELGLYPTPDIFRGDTVSMVLDIGGFISGMHPIEISLKVAGESQESNNHVYDTIQVSYPFGTVRINEFLAIPDSNQTEFVEISGTVSMPFTGWSLSDNTKTRHRIPDTYIQADSLIVIASDSILIHRVPVSSPHLVPENFPGLNNDQDAVFLYDMTGSVIDSLLYSVNWPLMKGRSTEKFRPEYLSNDSSRWGLAVNVDKLTPGKQNSLYYESLSSEGTLALSPNPFSPDGDGRDDLLFVKYKLPFEQGSVKVRIFDVTGRMIAVPYWNTVISQEGALVWDGSLTNGEPARIGIYIIKVSASDLSSNRSWEQIDTIVLAKPL